VTEWRCDKCGATGAELETTDGGPVICRECTASTLSTVLGADREVVAKGLRAFELLRDIGRAVTKPKR
jgi:hypothetical protein